MEPFVRKLLIRNDACRGFKEIGIRNGEIQLLRHVLGVVGLEDSGQGRQTAVLP